jgi:hypothetical protein
MGPLLPLGAYAAYGTEVPNVPKAHLSFLTGVQVSMEREKLWMHAERLQFPASNRENKRVQGFGTCLQTLSRGFQGLYLQTLSRKVQEKLTARLTGEKS